MNITQATICKLGLRVPERTQVGARPAPTLALKESNDD